jgi:predicted metal-dependent peptidase
MGVEHCNLELASVTMSCDNKHNDWRLKINKHITHIPLLNKTDDSRFNSREKHIQLYNNSHKTCSNLAVMFSKENFRYGRNLEQSKL